MVPPGKGFRGGGDPRLGGPHFWEGEGARGKIFILSLIGENFFRFPNPRVGSFAKRFLRSSKPAGGAEITKPWMGLPNTRSSGTFVEQRGRGGTGLLLLSPGSIGRCDVKCAGTKGPWEKVPTFSPPRGYDRDGLARQLVFEGIFTGLGKQDFTWRFITPRGPDSGELRPPKRFRQRGKKLVPHGDDVENSHTGNKTGGTGSSKYFPTGKTLEKMRGKFFLGGEVAINKRGPRRGHFNWARDFLHGWFWDAWGRGNEVF